MPLLFALATGIGVALVVSNTIADSARQSASRSLPPQKVSASPVLEVPLPSPERDFSPVGIEDEISLRVEDLVSLVTPAHTGRNGVGEHHRQTDRSVTKKQTHPDTPVIPPIEAVVKKGDTLSAIFKRSGINHRQLYELIAEKTLKKRLSRLQPGQKLFFHLDAGRRLQSLEWRLDETDTLHIERNGAGFKSEILKTTFERRLATASGIIDSSLCLAGQKAGLSNNLIMQMVGILGWDIDFALDIRAGDRFSVIYEELFAENGRKVRDGRIKAVEFTNRGRQVVALRYTDPTGFTDYYSPDGHSMRKAFLRTPVKFSRISSRFTRGRYHPVLNRIRAHKGVDYAAPTGTPIKAAGNGKITFKGRKGGYGRAIILRHGGRYSTLYGHMSRFAKSLKRGKKVRQGQVIGYVGRSGLATGPHLHYEFRVNGAHRNPLKVKLPKALPLEEKYRKEFHARIQPLLAHLDLLRRTQIALNEG